MEHTPDLSYEELSENIPLKVHVMAGGIAGVMEHCCVYPLDSIKTKMQSFNPMALKQYGNLTQTIRSVRNTQGLLSMFRGVNIMAMGAGPAHALYFTSYEVIKKNVISVVDREEVNSNHPLVSGTAAVVATVLHDAFMNPFEVIKQRLQMYNSPYKSSMDCVRTMVKNEPLSAFYWSYRAQLSMNIPFQIVHFTLYENISSLLHQSFGSTNEKGEINYYNPAVHVVAGGLSGGFAGAITTPLDVLKTVLNTQETSLYDHHHQQQTNTNNIKNGQLPQSKPVVINTMLKAAHHVHSTAGIYGFFKGAQARMLFHIPSTAICWSVYEFFKFFLNE